MNESKLNQLKEQEPIYIKDNSKRAKTLTTVFWIWTGITLIGLLAGYNELQILKKYRLENTFLNKKLTQMI